MEKSLAGADTYGCSTGHLLSNYVLGPFDRAVIKIEYAEVPLSSASLIVHPVDSQFVKEHSMGDDGVASESEKLSMSVCCLLSAVNFDIQGVLMTHGLGCRLLSPDLLVDRSVHDYMFHQ
ncbi:hypothetical protein H5410_009456 [Solanum commersonii]|uniref:Uncharacterized protein n=1 Tax=Solanum commersonii TaxID=4109 RepID=A0A9J6AHY7_SOLCO|nr:hypothetical protein H5410_009456 [Solanum commersonii]